MANIAGRLELGRHNRPATILRELEESRPPGALLRFVRLAALGSLRYARPPAAEAEAPRPTTRRGASIAYEVQLTLAVCAPRAWGPPHSRERGGTTRARRYRSPFRPQSFHRETRLRAAAPLCQAPLKANPNTRTAITTRTATANMTMSMSHK